MSSAKPPVATPAAVNHPPTQPRQTPKRYAYFAPYISPDDTGGQPTLWIQV